MKLDLFKKEWLDVVFEGRNKSYGAYDLRQKSSKTTAIALLIGASLLIFAIGAPKILGNFFDGLNKDQANNDIKVTAIKLPPKEKIVDPLKPPPPPPPPKQDIQKFVKPVVAKANEVVEEPPKTKEIEKVKTGAETVKGNPDAPTNIEPPGKEGGEATGEDPDKLYNTAGIEVKPEFPGGIDKFYSYLKNNFQSPEDESFKGGKVFVQFVVEKDGSLTDIKVLRDVGYGTAAEAMRLFKKCPRWSPGEQNGKKVRCTYVQTISLQAPTSE